MLNSQANSCAFRRNPVPKLLAALFSGLIIFVSLSPAGSASPNIGWTFDTWVEGNQQLIYVRDDGAAVQYTRVGVTVVYKAPWREVVLFNDKEKMICHLTPQQFRASMGAPEKRRALPAAVPRVNCEYAGLKAFTIKARGVAQDDAMEMFLPSGTRQRFAKCELCFSEPLAIAPRLLDMVDTLNRAPFKSGGVLLSLIHFYADGSRVPHLITRSARHGKVPASVLKIPANYRQVHGMRELCSDFFRQDLDGIAQDMGLGEPLGSHSKNNH